MVMPLWKAVLAIPQKDKHIGLSCDLALDALVYHQER